MAVTQGLVEWARAVFGPYGVLGLIALAFTEAVISPIPPDALLPLLAIGESVPYAVYLGLVTTAASIAGAAVGYWVGDRFSDWVHQRFSSQRLERVEAWYREYGEWVVGVAAFSPVPFKVFTVSSGLLGLRFWPFILAATIGRSLRFIPEAVLASIYGEPVIAWIDTYEIPLLILGLLVLVGLYVYSRRWGEDDVADIADEDGDIEATMES